MTRKMLRSTEAPESALDNERDNRRDQWPVGNQRLERCSKSRLRHSKVPQTGNETNEEAKGPKDAQKVD